MAVLDLLVPLGASVAQPPPALHVAAMVERGPYGIAFDLQRAHAAPGDTFTLVPDGRFPSGNYRYACVSHKTMEMAGLLYVESPAP